MSDPKFNLSHFPLGSAGPGSPASVSLVPRGIQMWSMSGVSSKTSCQNVEAQSLGGICRGL